MKQSENQDKLNPHEKEIVNLGNDDCAKEVKIRVHLKEDRKTEVKDLLRKYFECIYLITSRGGT